MTINPILKIRIPYYKTLVRLLEDKYKKVVRLVTKIL